MKKSFLISGKILVQTDMKLDINFYNTLRLVGHCNHI